MAKILLIFCFIKNVTTVCGHRIAHRICKATKQQPGTDGLGNMHGFCLVSFHSLWAILWPNPVQSTSDNMTLFGIGKSLIQTDYHITDITDDFQWKKVLLGTKTATLSQCDIIWYLLYLWSFVSLDCFSELEPSIGKRVVGRLNSCQLKLNYWTRSQLNKQSVKH